MYLERERNEFEWDSRERERERKTYEIVDKNISTFQHVPFHFFYTYTYNIYINTYIYIYSEREREIEMSSNEIPPEYHELFRDIVSGRAVSKKSQFTSRVGYVSRLAT